MKTEELLRRVAELTGHLKYDVTEIYMELIDQIKKELSNGKPVVLDGLGTISQKVQKSQIRWHPGRKEHFVSPAKRSLKLKPSKDVLKEINRSNSMKEKYGVEVDKDKTKEAEKKPNEKGDGVTRNVPWDPKEGTKPFEKKKEGE